MRHEDSNEERMERAIREIETYEPNEVEALKEQIEYYAKLLKARTDRLLELEPKTWHVGLPSCEVLVGMEEGDIVINFYKQKEIK